MERNEAIMFVTNHDDWEGLYINGRLVTEGHSLRRRDFVRHVQGCVGDIAEYYVNPEYTAEYGSLPAEFSEIPADQILERVAY